MSGNRDQAVGWARRESGKVAWIFETLTVGLTHFDGWLIVAIGRAARGGQRGRRVMFGWYEVRKGIDRCRDYGRNDLW